MVNWINTRFPGRGSTHDSAEIPVEIHNQKIDNNNLQNTKRQRTDENIKIIHKSNGSIPGKREHDQPGKVQRPP